MESSEHGLLHDDGMQAPLLVNGDDEDGYRVEPSPRARKNFSHFILINILTYLDGTPARYVSK